MPGRWSVQRIDAMLYAVVMESRGIYLTSDAARATVYGDSLLRFNEGISHALKTGRNAMRVEDAALFEPFAERLADLPGLPSRAGAARRRLRSGSRAPISATSKSTRSALMALTRTSRCSGEHFAKRAKDIYARDRPWHS